MNLDCRRLCSESEQDSAIYEEEVAEINEVIPAASDVCDEMTRVTSGFIIL